MRNKTKNLTDQKNLPLTISPKEASNLTGIGVNTLRRESNKPGCDFVMFVGNDRRYKTKKLIEWVDRTMYID